MHHFDRIIEAPAGAAWRILIDTREWPIWGPSVRAVEAPSHLIGAGTRGRIQTPVGLWLPFEITCWEPERAWGWRVAGIEATGHRVDHRSVCDAALRRIEERATSFVGTQ